MVNFINKDDSRIKAILVTDINNTSKRTAGCPTLSLPHTGSAFWLFPGACRPSWVEKLAPLSAHSSLLSFSGYPARSARHDRDASVRRLRRTPVVLLLRRRHRQVGLDRARHRLDGRAVRPVDWIGGGQRGLRVVPPVGLFRHHNERRARLSACVFGERSSADCGTRTYVPVASVAWCKLLGRES